MRLWLGECEDEFGERVGQYVPIRGEIWWEIHTKSVIAAAPTVLIR